MEKKVAPAMFFIFSNAENGSVFKPSGRKSEGGLKMG